MNSTKLLSILFSIIIIAGAALWALHMPYGQLIAVLGLVLGSIHQGSQISKLKKKVKDLEVH